MNILEKIKRFFKKILKKDSNTSDNRMLEKGEANIIDQKQENKRNEFMRNIDFTQEIENLNLQKKLEDGEISVDDLSIFKVMELIDLYQKQVTELNEKLKILGKKCEE